VEVLGRYSNLCDQGERIEALREIVPLPLRSAKTRTTKHVHRRLRPPEITELVAAYQGGKTVYEFAQQFSNKVSELLKREGVLLRWRSLSPSQIDLALELYREGHSAAAMAPHFECGPGTVRLALIKAGVRMRDSHGRER
jgi:predicted ATPase